MRKTLVLLGAFYAGATILAATEAAANTKTYNTKLSNSQVLARCDAAGGTGTTNTDGSVNCELQSGSWVVCDNGKCVGQPATGRPQ